MTITMAVTVDLTSIFHPGDLAGLRRRLANLACTIDRVRHLDGLRHGVVSAAFTRVHWRVAAATIAALVGWDSVVVLTDPVALTSRALQFHNLYQRHSTNQGSVIAVGTWVFAPGEWPPILVVGARYADDVGTLLGVAVVSTPTDSATVLFRPPTAPELAVLTLGK